MTAPESYPLPGYPNGVSSPWSDGRCPNDGNVYFFYDHAHFNKDLFPNGPPGMGADNDGSFLRRFVCTLCLKTYTAPDTVPGSFITQPTPNAPSKSDQVVVRTRAMLGDMVLYGTATRSRTGHASTLAIPAQPKQINSSDMYFSDSDTGRAVVVTGAGTGGANLSTTIQEPGANPPGANLAYLTTPASVALTSTLVTITALEMVPAIVTMTPESFVGAPPARPPLQRIHLIYAVPGGYQADVIDNVTGLPSGKVTQYWKEALNVPMGVAVGSWWFLESE